MKKITFAAGFILFALLTAGIPLVALAHQYQQQGSITVLLHTNPDDDPYVGQPAALLVSITDDKNKFDPATCDCGVTISDQTKILLQSPLYRVSAGNSIYDLTLPFTFPKKAVYQVTIAGKPQVPGAFQSFSVMFDLRVDRNLGQAASPDSGHNHTPLVDEIGIGGGIIFIVGYAGYMELKRRKYI